MAGYVVASLAGGITSSRSPSATFSSYTPLQNDVVVFFASSTTTAHTMTEPAGWVNPLGAGVDVESDSHQIVCAYHLVTSSEASAGTTTYTATNWYGATQTGELTACVIRDVDGSNVVDSANSTFSSTNSATPHVLASLTGTNLSTDSLVVSSVAKDATGTYTTPGGWTQIITSNTNQGRWLGRRDALTVANSDVTATNITPSAGDEYASITVAFTASPMSVVAAMAPMMPAPASW